MAVTTQYLVEDDVNPTGLPQVLEEVQNGAAVRTYTYGLQRISESQFINNVWTTSFYGYDGGGNVRQLTNSSGIVTDEYEYDAYGNSFTKSGTTPNNYLYRAEQYDPDLGLYYLRARYYNPATGRFMSRDPLNGKQFDPKTLHRYLYAGGDPVNRIDPMGREDMIEYVVPIIKYVFGKILGKAGSPASSVMDLLIDMEACTAQAFQDINAVLSNLNNPNYAPSSPGNAYTNCLANAINSFL